MLGRHVSTWLGMVVEDRGDASRMRKKSASGVLARHCRLTISPASTDVALIMLRAVDLAAALLDGHFEHPAEILAYCVHMRIIGILTYQNNFSATC